MILSYIHPLDSVLIEFLPHDLTFSRKRVDYWNSALRDVFLAKCRVYGMLSDAQSKLTELQKYLL